MAEGKVKPVHAARAPPIAGPHQPDRKSDLAGGRTGQKLAQRHQIDVSLFIEPAPAHDEFFAEIPDMRDRPAEAADAELEENEQDFERRAHAPCPPAAALVYGVSHRVAFFHSRALSTNNPCRAERDGLAHQVELNPRLPMNR